MARRTANLRSRRFDARRRIAGKMLLSVAAVCTLLLSGLGVAAVSAQNRELHYQYRIEMPPGEIGRRQLERGGPLPGYFQPVEIRAPQGAMVSLAVGGDFEPPQPCPVTAGMLIGHAYRIKVVGIPLNEGFEVYPTIEVINRLYPPPGQEARFPIPVQLTREELELALNGRYVTRVIYLEDPATALPRLEEPGRQRYFEVRTDQDPVEVADQLGRPMAILRMGSRVPDAAESNESFLYGAPPLIKFATEAFSKQSAPGRFGRASGAERHYGNIPPQSPHRRDSSTTWRVRAAQSP